MTTIELQDSDRGFDIIADSESVGYITFDERGGEGYIQRVFIEPDQRRNGYAKAAVGHLVNQFGGRLTSGPTASRAMEAILRTHGFEFHQGKNRPQGCEADLWIHDHE